MTEDKQQSSAGEKSPVGNAGAGEVTLTQEDLALWLDMGIMQLLGLKAEVMDDFIKTWPREVEPDETNFLIGSRFSQNLDESVNILEGLKATIELFEEDGNHWAVVTLPQGVIETTETSSKEMAAAFGVYAVLWGLRKGASKS